MQTVPTVPDAAPLGGGMDVFQLNFGILLLPVLKYYCEFQFRLYLLPPPPLVNPGTSQEISRNFTCLWVERFICNVVRASLIPPDEILRLFEHGTPQTHHFLVLTKILVRTFWHQAASSTILPPKIPNAAELRNGPIFMKLVIFFIQNFA